MCLKANKTHLSSKWSLNQLTQRAKFDPVDPSLSYIPSRNIDAHNHTKTYKHILIHRPLGKTPHTNHILPVWSTNIINMDLYNTISHCLIYLPVCASINLSAPLLSTSPRMLTYNIQYTYVNTTLSKMKQPYNAMYLHRIHVKIHR